MAVLKKIKFGNSENPIQFTEVKPANGGVITATGANTDLDNVNNPEYVIDLTIADDGTLAKENGALKVHTVPAAQVSVVDSGEKLTATDVEAALSELKDDIDEVGGAAKSYTIIEKTTDLPTNVAHRYKLQQTIGEGATAQVTEVGENIDILKDNSLLAAKLSTMDATWDAKNKVIVDGTGKQALVLVYQDADGAAQVIHIDVSAFLNESEFKDGLAVSANGEVSAKLGQGLEFGGESGEGVNQSIKVKVDSTSEKDTQSTPTDFLTVGADGIKITGIKDEIDRKIAALDVTNTAVDGEYVSSVSETNGVVSTTKAKVSDAVLTGYAKGEKPASTAIAATDDVKGAIAKLEHQVDDTKAVIEENEHVTSAALNDINDKINGMDTDLDAEIAARKAVDGQNGQTYAANASANYISEATSLNDADVKLDAALKGVSNKVDGIKYNVSGTTLILSGISQDTTLS